MLLDKLEQKKNVQKILLLIKSHLRLLLERLLIVQQEFQNTIKTQLPLRHNYFNKEEWNGISYVPETASLTCRNTRVATPYINVLPWSEFRICFKLTNSSALSVIQLISFDFTSLRQKLKRTNLSITK